MTIKHAAILVSLAFLAVAQGERLQVDFSTDAGTQAGWEGLGGTADGASKNGTFSGYPELAPADITVTLTGLGFNRRYDNGGGNDNFPETDLDAMYGDLLFRNNDSETVDVTIAGLQAGTYQITTHHLIDTPNPGTFDLDVQDADSPSFGQSVGTFSQGTGNASTFSPKVISFLVVSNGTDDIIIRMTQGTPTAGGTTGGWFGFNGLEVRLPPTEFQLDFDNSSPAAPGNTQSDWEAFSESSDPNNKTLRYAGYPAFAAGDITITTTGVEFTRNYDSGSSTAPDFPGTNLDRVCNDLILRNDNDGGASLNVEISGLLAGTYQITTHHLVNANTSQDPAEFDLNVQDSDSPAFGQFIGNFAMGKDELGPTTTVFTVNSNGSDPVILKLTGTYFNPLGGTLNWVGINGLEVAIPAAVKDDNTDDLNLGTSWVAGTAPDSDALAIWDSTVTGANTTALGVDTTWGGVAVQDPVGTVTIGAGNTLTLAGSGSVIELSAATADLTLNCDLVVSAGEFWQVPSGRTVSVTGAISGSSGIDMVADGTAILSGANSYAGNTSVKGGIVQLGASDVIPNGSGTGDVSVSGLLDLNGNSDTINGLSGSGTIDNAADSTSATLTVGDNDASGTFDGILQNSGSSATLNLGKTGTGTLTLGDANTYDGTTTISGGTLQIGDLSALGNTSGITLAGGTTFAPTVDGLTVSAPVTLGGTGTTSTVDLPVSGATTLTFDGAIGGDGNLLLYRSVGNVTAGTIVLGDQSTYLGTTKFDTVGGVSSGSQLTVRLGVADALPSTTVLTLDGGGSAGSGRTLQLDLNGFNQTLAGLQNVTGLVGRNQRVTSTGAATLTINNSTDYTFGGSIDFTFNSNPYTSAAQILGDISLVKSGGGTFTLLDSHTYTGSTSVNGGTLGLDDATLGSAITLAGGASMEFTLGSPSTTSSTLDLGTGTVKIVGAVDGSSDYPLMTATGGITGTLALDSPITDYVLELRNGDTELWLALNPYAAWATGFLPTDVSDPSGNGDGDSLSNLLEFAFGTDPTDSDGLSLGYTEGPPAGFTAGTPVVFHDFPPGGGVDFKARFIRRTDAGDSGSVDYAWRFSSDLTDWESSDDTPSWFEAPTVLVTDGDYELVEVPYPFKLDTGPKARFFQVEVTEAP